MSMKSQNEEKMDKMRQQLAQIKIENEQLVGTVQKHEVINYVSEKNYIWYFFSLFLNIYP